MVKQENFSLKEMFKEFAKEFRLGNVDDVIKEINEPLECKSLDQMLSVIEKLRDKIQARVDKMYTGTNFLRKDVDNFMENPNNFSKIEWKAIEKFKNETEKYVKEFQIASQGAGIREIVKEGRRRAKKKGKLARLDDSKKWIQIS